MLAESLRARKKFRSSVMARAKDLSAFHLNAASWPAVCECPRPLQRLLLNARLSASYIQDLVNWNFT